MKVLTIKNPWVELIMQGLKKYEFRTWKTNYRGKILIHAGKRYDKRINEKFNNYHLSYIYGAIIGEATIEDVILVDEKMNKDLTTSNDLIYTNHIGCYAWKLTNIVKYEKPIYINGKLGLWNYEKK